MKKVLFFSITAVLISCSSCSKKENYKDISSTGIDYPTCPNGQPTTSPRYVIIPADSVDGRPTFNIEFEDGKVLEQMYGEEIAQSLITGKWRYNEYLMIVEER